MGRFGVLFAGWLLLAAAPAEGLAAVGTADVVAAMGSGQVEITYTLVATEPSRVRLRGVRDGALPLRVRGVQGAAGEGIAAGPGHRLVWPYLADYPGGLDDVDVSLELLAEPVAGAGVLVVPVRAAFGIGFTDAVFARCLAAAEAAGVQVVIAEIDSPGGSALVAEDATDRLQAWRAAHPEVQLVAHVVGEAAGVAALFASAFDELYLSPGASIGGDVPAEDAEILVGLDLSPPPRFRFYARRWLEARGVPQAVREELIRKETPRRFDAEQAVEAGVAGAVVADRSALGAWLGYSVWEGRSEAAEQVVAERAAVVRRGLGEYDALAAMIDAGLAELERTEPGANRLAARSIMELAKDLGELQEQFPFVKGLFEKEFPGGVAAVLAVCREAGQLAPTDDGRLASAHQVRRRRRGR